MADFVPIGGMREPARAKSPRLLKSWDRFVYLEIENSAGYFGGDAICALDNPRPGTVLPCLIDSALGADIQALGEGGDLSSQLGGLRAFVKFEHFSVFFLNYPLSRFHLDPVRVQCDTIEAIGFISFGRGGAGKACQFK